MKLKQGLLSITAFHNSVGISSKEDSSVDEMMSLVCMRFSRSVDEMMSLVCMRFSRSVDEMMSLVCMR